MNPPSARGPGLAVREQLAPEGRLQAGGQAAAAIRGAGPPGALGGRHQPAAIARHPALAAALLLLQLRRGEEGGGVVVRTWPGNAGGYCV